MPLEKACSKVCLTLFLYISLTFLVNPVNGLAAEPDLSGCLSEVDRSALNGKALKGWLAYYQQGDRKIVTSGAKRPELESERKAAALIQRLGHCLLRGISPGGNGSHLSWTDLSRIIETNHHELPRISRYIHYLHAWFTFIRDEGERFRQLYNYPFQPVSLSGSNSTTYYIVDDVLLTPGLESMWNHCRKRFHYLFEDWQLLLRSGYESPAYLFYRFLKASPDPVEALEQRMPPFFSRHMLPIPDISIDLKHRGEHDRSKPWKELYDTCSEFGFAPSFPDREPYRGELGFRGIEEMYRDILDRSLVPRRFSSDFKKALLETGFFPSPRGLRMILALAAQESTIQWNPRLNVQKKQLLGKRFNRLLLNLKDSFPGTMTSLILEADHESSLEKLIRELQAITDPENEDVREYDFFLWSRRTFHFIKMLKKHYSNMAAIGQWFFDLEGTRKQLEFEPQTFGIWQVNVNHLFERMQTHTKLRRIFPEIYQRSGENWIINRIWLIEALSGRPEAKLNRVKTLKLIIYTYLKPRYENHHLGSEQDLTFFAAENMAGEMSTFRAAVQHELNNKMNAGLELDGDLTYYLPHSTRINWKTRSNSYRAMEQFISRHLYYFDEPVNRDLLIKQLCLATSYQELRESELYRKIMGNSENVRIFPEITSTLYHQTPRQYSAIVVRKSYLF